MSEIRRTDPLDRTILILAPSRRDAPTLASVMGRAGIKSAVCASIGEVCEALTKGAGAALVAEESFGDLDAAAAVLDCLSAQPPWSEPPIVIVTAAGSRARSANVRRLEKLASLQNVVLLERPLRSATLISTMRSALQARQRQYQVRDHLHERELNEERLHDQERELRLLNETLEERVKERTVELEDANRRLIAEIEHREQAERALRQAQKMEAIGQLTGGIAHDFNNLLMVVSGGLDMLDRTTDPDRRNRIVAGMRQAAGRGEKLTRQLLAFSRRIALSPEPVNLRALLDGMQILVAGALRGDISIRLGLPDDLWPVMADPTQLELAILNAAVNARDAMPDGGSLTVEARNEVVEKLGDRRLAGEFVRIEIRDTGTGIPADLLERVFDPFFTTKAVDQGTGLGMSQIYGFAQQSGGHVGIRSEAAAGTSLILHLPRAAEADSPSTDASDATPEARTWPAGAGLEVLLVEDNEEVATMAAEILRELGLVVRRVPDARSALVLLEDGVSVDIVFSDIVMPGGMSGIELAHEIRRRRPGLPIVLTTGYSEGVSDHAGIDGFPLLNKPYAIGELQTVFRRVFSPCPHVQSSPKTT